MQRARCKTTNTIKRTCVKNSAKTSREQPLAGSTTTKLLKINNGAIDKVPTKRSLVNENNTAKFFDLSAFITAQRSSTSSSTSDKEEDSSDVNTTTKKINRMENYAQDLPEEKGNSKRTPMADVSNTSVMINSATSPSD